MKALLSDTKVQAGFGILLLILGGINFWLWNDHEEFHPDEYLKVALKRLVPRSQMDANLVNLDSAELRRQALQATRWAEAVAYPGQELIVSFDYLYGIIYFGDAMAMEGDPSTQKPMLRKAAWHLREADQGEDPQYKHRLKYAYGVCLQKLGNTDEAINQLEQIFDFKEAIKAHRPGKSKDDIEIEPLSARQLLDASLRLQNMWWLEKDEMTLLKAARYSNAVYWVLQQGPGILPLHEEQPYPEMSPQQLDQVDPNNKLVFTHQGITKFTDEQRYEALILRAQVYAAVNRISDLLDSHPELTGVSVDAIIHRELTDEERNLQSTKLIQAQHLMEEGLFQQARKGLEEIAHSKGLDRTYARKALFLIGECDRESGELLIDENDQQERFDRAIVFYERTADEFSNTPEGVAANLWAAVLHQKVGKDEQALQRYRKALKSIEDVEEFQNIWLSLLRFQDEVHRGWRRWIDEQKYDDAIALSKWLPRLFSEARSKELVAETYKQHALYLDERLKSANYSQWKKLKTEMRAVWVQAGAASEEKAQYLKNASEYSDALWESSDQYRRGHDFKKSIRVTHQFISCKPGRGLARAYVRLGENYMDLDLLDDAIEAFKRVILEYPTDVFAFEAQHLLGQCYFEKSYLDEKNSDNLAKAEEAWVKVYTSEKLTPDALEWRRTLFGLGRLYFLKGSMIYNQNMISGKESKENDSANESDRLNEAFDYWSLAIDRLDELLVRLPDGENQFEARYLLAHAYRRSAEKPAAEFEIAETDTAREGLRLQVNEFNLEAMGQFEILRDKLLKLKNADRLDELGQRILRNSYFEIAHILYALGDIDAAKDAYFAAVTEYPDDEMVILSYIQIANCFKQKGQDLDANAFIATARFTYEKFLQDGTIFAKNKTNLSQDEWGYWLDWTRNAYGLSQADSTEEGDLQ
ncbi:Tetratricopeptide repeat protein [Polystyrenella longa]|uniref:Tetratricopeptide repeat protein n=1 Tax=Polystyrenella longa TaxID=2528007 RepID=A0A518CIT9_9PLAN|nr:tetratricopeptide repeat protein [Polystyrenella longa]QDU79107.1 Tetratricopeptide repeat protein [Polystyrenella longa]